MKIGYARVSTDEQDTAAQVGALENYGCTTIYKENKSGGKPVVGPVLERSAAPVGSD